MQLEVRCQYPPSRLTSTSPCSSSFTPAGPEVNIYGIAFKDKKREAARQVRLAKEMAAGGKNAKTLKAEIKKSEKLARTKKYEEEQRAKGRNVNKKKGKNARIHDEWDELAKEEVRWGDRARQDGAVSEASHEGGGDVVGRRYVVAGARSPRRRI